MRMRTKCAPFHRCGEELRWMAAIRAGSVWRWRDCVVARLGMHAAGIDGQLIKARRAGLDRASIKK